MTMTIPTVPYMPAGYVVQPSDMNALAACATFLLTKPVARIHDVTGSQAMDGSADIPAVVINFTTVDIDTDGMWAAIHPERLTIQTQGFYKVRYGVNNNNAGK